MNYSSSRSFSAASFAFFRSLNMNTNPTSIKIVKPIDSPNIFISPAFSTPHFASENAGPSQGGGGGGRGAGGWKLNNFVEQFRIPAIFGGWVRLQVFGKCQIMCHFITMVIPGSADQGLVRTILHENNRGFYPLDNRQVRKVLKAGEIYFNTCDKYCDCGTKLGSYQEPDRELQAAALNKELAKLKKKGWSQAKIGRWCADREKAHRIEAPVGDPDGWVLTIRSLLTDAKLPYAGVLLHMYKGDIQTERMMPARFKAPLDESLAHKLWRLPEDTLLIVGG